MMMPIMPFTNIRSLRSCQSYCLRPRTLDEAHFRISRQFDVTSGPKMGNLW